MRPCPTCECFVPAAARRCPRCEAALEPIETGGDAGTERGGNGSREPVLVGAGRLASPLTGSGHAAAVINGAAPIRVAPAIAPAKRNGACHPDPIVAAVVLAISELAPDAPVETIDTVHTVELAPDAPDETVVSEPHDETVAAEPEPAHSADSFAALLGNAASVIADDELLPVPAPTPAHVSAPAPTLVAVPVAPAEVTGRAPATRRRFSRSDPFARTTTRRERMLTRICMGLALTLALAVVVLRLPLGARPDLGATSTPTTNASSTSVTTSSVFNDAIREQTQADLQVVIATAQRLYPVWKSFAPESPLTLNRAVPQFGFVTRSQPSQRVGEMSVWGSARSIVLAEYAGPDHCAFARLVSRHAPEIVPPVRAPCTALAAPQHGWVTLTS